MQIDSDVHLCGSQKLAAPIDDSEEGRKPDSMDDPKKGLHHH